jgi:hypothetical protein
VSGSPTTGQSARRRRLVTVVVAVVGGLAIGAGLTLALTGTGGDGQTSSDDSGPVTTAASAGDDGSAPSGAAAPSPRAAVEGFLAAEIDGELAASFGFLDAATRERFRSSAGWIAAHAEVIPPVTGYEVEGPSPGGESQVVTLVQFEPSLDEVRGLVPERATVTWATSDDGGRWGIDLDRTIIEPLYPSDESAPAGVMAWAEAHQACEPAPTWGGNLQGSPALAEQLCGAKGGVEVGAPSPLTSVDGGPFLAAFGPGAGEWARVVPVTAPVELRAVVAPIGQEWLVIGVLPA